MYPLAEHDSDQPTCKRMCLQSCVKDFAPFCVQKSKIVSWYSQDSTRVPVAGNACILWYLPIITDVGSEEVSKTRQWEKYK